jgi:hypothetical protein
LGEAIPRPSQNILRRVKQRFTHGEMISLRMKRRFADDEIFRRRLPNRGQASATPRDRNQPCCIKIVKWFYPILVERLEIFHANVMFETGTSG